MAIACGVLLRSLSCRVAIACGVLSQSLSYRVAIACGVLSPSLSCRAAIGLGVLSCFACGGLARSVPQVLNRLRRTASTGFGGADVGLWEGRGEEAGTAGGVGLGSDGQRGPPLAPPTPALLRAPPLLLGMQYLGRGGTKSHVGGLFVG